MMTKDLLVSMHAQCMSSEIFSGKGSDELSFTQPSLLTMSTCMELLLAVLRANDQYTLLDLTRGILSHPGRQSNSDTPPWILLAIWPSILYLASTLGFTSIAETLLPRGIISKAPETEFFGSFQMAAVRGHIDVVQKYLAHDVVHKRQIWIINRFRRCLKRWCLELCKRPHNFRRRCHRAIIQVDTPSRRM